MRVTVDEHRCIASGLCTMTLPEIFQQRTDDGVSLVVRPVVPEDSRDEVADAAGVCPGRAITIEND